MTPRSKSRFRLIDGVIVAAIGMLGLKLMAMFVETGPVPPPESAAPPGFARVLAHARTNFSEVEPATTGSVPDKKADEPPPKDVLGDAPAGSSSPTERALLQRLGERREELQQRARDAETREKVLDEQERRLDERLKQASAGEEAKKGAADARGGPENATIRNLVTMYESMKPKEAARVFERLPMDVLLSVVVAMNARKMSEVLAAMNPEAAEKLTVALARKPKMQDPAAVSPLPPGELQAIDPPIRR